MILNFFEKILKFILKIFSYFFPFFLVIILNFIFFKKIFENLKIKTDKKDWTFFYTKYEFLKLNFDFSKKYKKII